MPLVGLNSDILAHGNLEPRMAAFNSITWATAALATDSAFFYVFVANQMPVCMARVAETARLYARHLATASLIRRSTIALLGHAHEVLHWLQRASQQLYKFDIIVKWLLVVKFYNENESWKLLTTWTSEFVGEFQP